MTLARAVAWTAVAVCAVGGLFVYLHTGTRTASTCYQLGSAVADGMSLWPPGVRCSGGEPEIVRVRMNPAFPFALVAAGLVAFGTVRLTQWVRR